MFDKSYINKKIEELILSLDKISKDKINALDLIDQLISRYNKDYDLTKGENFIYLQKGANPKLVLHLNISNVLSRFSYGFLDKDNEKYLITDKNPDIINPILIFESLAKFSDLSFDILITMNNIYDKRMDFSILKNILRSDNIINFNLKQANCLAENFASFTIVDIDIPIERIDFNKDDFSFFSIGIKDLVGGNSGLDLDKVRLNAIKSLLGVVRKLKSKVDIEILSFDGGNRFDDIPNNAKFEICVHKEYIKDLIEVFDFEKNDFLQKTLKLEPNVNLYLEESDSNNYLPMTKDTFTHLASFIELSINGAYAVDTSNGQLISSSIISNAKTYNDYLNLVLVFRSLSNNGLKEMIEKTKLACKVSNANLKTKYYIPAWKNIDHTLTDIFKNAYKQLKDQELNIINTQYSIEGNLIFNALPVKMISLGVKYYKGDNNKFYSKLDDLSELVGLIGLVLSKIEEN
ncbi:MAG: hypothetical protein PUG67_06305 [Peptoniphilaceae bacterium]|nr:hypothetical protein [Peptoniphilaceae bacterium]MDY6018669.1 hypothetical protein [Anaerococcus sp.]